MKTYLLLLLALSLTIVSCDKDDDQQSLTLDLQGLEDLGSGYQYEGWIIVDGMPESTGTFTVNTNGDLSTTSFPLDAGMLSSATTFVLTIEPNPDNNPAPTDVHILAGDFAGSSANVTVGHGAALGNMFTSATGQYILATPTDGNMEDEASGVWFLDPAGPSATLSLPTLPAGWEYEGWAVINGTPVTTGKFLTVAGADDAAPYSGNAPAPPFPGEDFLVNAPSGLTFPTDLRNGMVVISIEPYPDNSPAPFTMKPLVGSVPGAAAPHTLQSMNNNAAASNPAGTVRR